MTDGSFEFEVAIVGAGPAGLAAACAAAECGRRVGLVDETPWLGGQIWRGQSPQPAAPQARLWFDRFRNSGASLLPRTSVIAAPAPGLLLAEHNERPCQIRWQRLVLATGARELFLPFPGWTLPGVIGPGGLQALVKHGWPIRGQRLLLAGTGPLLLAVAAGLRKHGAQLVSVAEQAPWSRLANFALGLSANPARLLQAAQLKLALWSVPYRCSAWPVRVDENGRGLRVTLTNGQETWTENCDLFACGFGFVPNLELPLVLGCELADGFVKVDRFQATTSPAIYCAGETTGIGGAEAALVEGRIAGYAVAGETRRAEALFPQRAAAHRFRSRMARAFALRDELKSLASDETLVCRCEDVSLGQMKRFGSWREAKLQSRCGMGACQGRVCGAAAKVLLGWDADSLRPPVLPARVRSLVLTPEPASAPAQSRNLEPSRSRLQPAGPDVLAHDAPAVRATRS